MSDKQRISEQEIFDADARSELSAMFDRLPAKVQLNVWADVGGSHSERQAISLCTTLADQFETIQSRLLPRRNDYPYYPVIGVMGLEHGELNDLGVRIIGLPNGYQMTSLITAIQAVSFRGSTMEPRTRIGLHKLPTDVTVELMTSAENEGGPLMAKLVFGMACASPRVRAYLIMSDEFPEANLRYSIRRLPHTVLNGRVHVEGVIEEATMLEHVRALIAASAQ